MEALWQNLRYAARILLKRPGFTAVALLTLTLGIGANSAIFSVVNTVLLEPLPYKQPEKLLTLWEVNKRRGDARATTSYPDFTDFRDQAQSLEYVAAYQTDDILLTDVNEPEDLEGAYATADMFPLLGVNLALGR